MVAIGAWMKPWRYVVAAGSSDCLSCTGRAIDNGNACSLNSTIPLKGGPSHGDDGVQRGLADVWRDASQGRNNGARTSRFSWQEKLFACAKPGRPENITWGAECQHFC
jgi:hypothetical protein